MKRERRPLEDAERIEAGLEPLPDLTGDQAVRAYLRRLRAGAKRREYGSIASTTGMVAGGGTAAVGGSLATWGGYRWSGSLTFQTGGKRP